ncbi:MAG: DUF5979 domain-containing protein, partial [Clostridia bacterium]|nr:DUF5979 domain-containing protein [Clostridia bacterium]
NYQVSGTSKLTLPNTASGIPNPKFNTDVGSIAHGSTNLKVGSTINATYNGEQMTLTFKGWNTSPDGNGINYAPGSNISISEDTVLYAIWEGELVPGELYIYKTVTAEDGAAEPSGATYQFSIKFSTVGLYSYTVYNADGSAIFSGSLNTQGTINLVNGQYAAFTGIPANTTYKVTENEGSYTTTFEGDSGVVRSGGRAVARFVNHYVYIEPEITINYIAKDGGSVTISSEVVKVNTGNAQGSTATAGKGYRFVGWYSDSDCTKLLSQESKYVPTKEDGTEWINGTTFYAKFEPDNTSLTIKKVYPDGADYSIDENQTFIFTIKGVPGTNTAAIDLTVTIHGSGEITITDLPIGDYVVTEQTEWSWRYEPTGGATKEITLTANVSENTVTFENSKNKTQWLDSETYAQNIYNGNGVVIEPETDAESSTKSES